MGERAGRRGVRQVVGGHVYGLYRRDGAVLGRRNTLLQGTDVVCQRGLIAYGRRHTAEQRGYFGTSLNETENVVDKQQYVLTTNVTEVFCHGQTGQANAHTRSRRLVHLAIYQNRLVNNAGLLHFAPQVVTLTGTLAYAGEYGIAAVRRGYVMNEFHDQYRLAYAGAAEQAYLTAQGVRCNQVYDLDARFQNLFGGRLVLQGRSRTVNRPVVGRFYLRIIMVNGFAQYVKDTAQATGTHRHLNGGTRVDGFHTAHQTVRGAHGYATDYVLADMLHHFGGQVDFDIVTDHTVDMNRIVDLRELFRRKLNVDNRPQDRYNFASRHLCFPP